MRRSSHPDAGRRGRIVAAAAAAALGLAGCAGTSSSGSDDAASTAGSGSAPPATATAAKPHHHRRAQARRASPATHRSGLPVSTASSTTVQPQPPADSCHARGAPPFTLPDRHCTPGAISPAVTQADLASTICRRGYTRTVRPSESITEAEKRDSMAAYGDAGSAHDYEYDHLVSLELGGAPNDPRNLWPEPGGSPNTKDRLEDRLHELVCAGGLTLRSAQTQIATDWVAAYRRQFG